MSDVETKRGRVRRLLIEPLASGYGGMGFRFPKGTDEKKQRSYLDWLADWLGYLSDEELERLRACLSAHGDGAKRCFWPARATVVFFAQAARPRPIETWPECASWFASIEGAKAREEGTLVATMLFIERNIRPPYTPKDRREVAARTAELQRAYTEAQERVTRDRAYPDDAQMIAWYDRLTERAEALVGAERQGHAA
ncbi:hypothetical protein [Marinovum sp.]|uniref:hypothetical protein n=1 Tax=Marinovum sp. TaxID=2024839 RepID=UPI002B26ADFA|nr:hypothetical protein [Marinovum sp.]